MRPHSPKGSQHDRHCVFCVQLHPNTPDPSYSSTGTFTPRRVPRGTPLCPSHQATQLRPAFRAPTTPRCSPLQDTRLTRTWTPPSPCTPAVDPLANNANILSSRKKNMGPRSRSAGNPATALDAGNAGHGNHPDCQRRRRSTCSRRKRPAAAVPTRRGRHDRSRHSCSWESDLRSLFDALSTLSPCHPACARGVHQVLRGGRPTSHRAGKPWSEASIMRRTAAAAHSLYGRHPYGRLRWPCRIESATQASPVRSRHSPSSPPGCDDVGWRPWRPTPELSDCQPVCRNMTR